LQNPLSQKEESAAQGRPLLDQSLRQCQPPEWYMMPIDTPSSTVVEEEDKPDESTEEDRVSSDEHKSN
jgi:hypothetical protein